MEWMTGIGKTIGAISIAIKFIEQLKIMHRNNIIPEDQGSIYIIGFSERIFKTELLRYPEFEFLSVEEKIRLERINKIALQGDAEGIRKLSEFNALIRKRFDNRIGNGFFKFIGYRAFVSRVFYISEEYETLNINELSDEEMKENIEQGIIKVNEELLRQFNNSLIICDEIHQVYNAQFKNNWGFTIQYLIDSIQTLRALYLTATPIENPTEVIDLLNLLIIKEELTNKKGEVEYINKKDFFKSETELLPNALERIKTLSRGKVSYIREINPKYYPEKIMIGEMISQIPYLKFTRCPMSRLHYKTYKEVFTGVLPLESQYLVDFVMPNPNKESDIGLFQSQQIRKEISGAPKRWKEKYGIDYKDNILVGTLMKMENLKQYSTKYTYMIRDILKHIKNRGGKIFIYHNMVHISGILFIQEVLLRNGIIDEFGGSNPSTLCVICGEPKKDHTEGSIKGYITQKERAKEGGRKYKISDHKYRPVRFILIHSEIGKIILNRSIEKYNDVDNMYGHEYLIMVGARIVKESYDFKAIRKVMVMGRPDNIPALKQVIGRTVRKNSHTSLPLELRNVTIRIYTTSLPIKFTVGPNKGKWKLSYEEEKYLEKMNYYKVIQEIEKVFHENAVDAPVNKDIIWTEEERKKYSVHLEIKDLTTFDALWFEPSIHPPRSFALGELNLDTFNIYYAQKEVEKIIVIIKRLFIEMSSVWKYEHLWKAVKKPPFDLETNPSLFSKEWFNIALNILLWNEEKNYTTPILSDAKKEERIIRNINTNVRKINELLGILFNPDEKLILLPNGVYSAIVHMGEFYILFPINMVIGTPSKDIDYCYRAVIHKSAERLNIDSFLKQHVSLYSYEEQKEKFVKKWKPTPFEYMEPLLCETSIDFYRKFIEECIAYIFNMWTDPTQKKSPLHSFYFKILYYFDFRDLIVWAATVKDYLLSKYERYIARPKKEKEEEKKEKRNKEELERKYLLRTPEKEEISSNLLNLLRSSLGKSIVEWAPSEAIKKMQNDLEKSLKMYIGSIKTPMYRERKRVQSDLLPVGHFIADVPRFYDPKKREFFDSPEYLDTAEEFVENDIIIGYDEKLKNSIDIKFKIRSPIQYIEKFKDIRMIERGSVCSTKSKHYLKDIAQKLDVELPEKLNVQLLCEKIRNKLIYNEIRERKAKTNVKWYYTYYEKQIRF
jgi:hypothetical protein